MYIYLIYCRIFSKHSTIQYLFKTFELFKVLKKPKCMLTNKSNQKCDFDENIYLWHLIMTPQSQSTIYIYI